MMEMERPDRYGRQWKENDWATGEWATKEDQYIGICKGQDAWIYGFGVLTSPS